MENACLNDQQKSAIAERLAIAEHCLLEGADEYLQVKSFPPLIISQLLSQNCSPLSSEHHTNIIQVMAVATSMMKTLTMG